MGWVALAAIGVVAMGLMAAFGLSRGLWSMVAAALMLGAAGYALQGRPDLAAHPVATRAMVSGDDREIIDLRSQMFGRFGADDAYLIASDGMARAGERQAAVAALLGGIRHSPGDATLWTALGTALVAHDGGNLSPAALFAFHRAMQLAPSDPAPAFFMGMAYVQAGNFPLAKVFWERALQLTPADASYRGDIVMRLSLLDRVLAMTGSDPHAN